MSLDVREYAGTNSRTPFPMQPPIGGATALTSAGTYTVVGPGATLLEIFANGADHTFTITGSALVQTIKTSERLVYGVQKGAVLTVAS